MPKSVPLRRVIPEPIAAALLRVPEFRVPKEFSAFVPGFEALQFFYVRLHRRMRPRTLGPSRFHPAEGPRVRKYRDKCHPRTEFSSRRRVLHDPMLPPVVLAALRCAFL